MEYIPYILYVITPGTRFERDKKVFFDPDGEVSRGEPLINYGWSDSGFKELIEAFYMSKKGTTKGFDKYYATIKGHPGNVVLKLKKDNLVPNNLRGFIELRLKQNVAVPVLYVEINNIYYRFCADCPISFQVAGFPIGLSKFLERINLLPAFQSTFQCTRQICKSLCEYYKDCVLSYTSTEGNPEVEKKKENCLIDMFKKMIGESSGSSRYEHVLKPGVQYANILTVIGRPRRRKFCFERRVRFDFTPLRYFFFDPHTWSEMKKERYNKTGFRPNFNAIPAYLISDFLSSDKYFEGAGLQASHRRRGVLECFLRISEIKFEIKYNLTPYDCAKCTKTHSIIGIPIKAMFRSDIVFKHEANFAELLWQKLWQKYSDDFCKSFDGKSVIRANESQVLRREMQVEEIYAKSQFSQHSYDYVIDMTKLGINKKRLLLFDLTTGLWKKSGFHEEARTPEYYLDMWREMLYKIPLKKADAIAIWYILVNSTEDTFFDATAPAGATSMNQLLAQIASDDIKPVKTVTTADDASTIDLTLHKLIVVPVFKTLRQKRAFYTELERLERKRFDLLLISRVVDLLLS